jgi:hypothetical protein
MKLKTNYIWGGGARETSFNNTDLYDSKFGQFVGAPNPIVVILRCNYFSCHLSVASGEYKI